MSKQSLQSLQLLFWEESEVFVLELGGCVQDRGRCKLHEAQICTAGSFLQLQNGHVVDGARAKNVSWDKECLLRASGWPVTTHIDPINPNLPLGRKEETTEFTIALVKNQEKSLRRYMKKDAITLLRPKGWSVTFCTAKLKKKKSCIFFCIFIYW